MSFPTPAAPLPEKPWGRDLLLLAAVFGLILGWRLGSAPLLNPDEGRYAEVPREMVAGGDWVTPRLDGVPYFEKPPLVYWMVAACQEILGPGEWSLRATPALFGLGGILLAYAAGRALYGRDAGLWSGVVLGTSVLYAALAHLLLLDTAVSVLMSSTLFCFILAVREPAGPRRRWLLYGLYASAALATLTKGLMGFLITGAIMLLWLAVAGQWRRLRPLHLPTGIVLFLAIALPWHVAVARRNPEWPHFYLVYEHWQRFLEKGHGRYQPPWFFVPILLLGLFPWTGLAWSALRDGLAGGWARRRENAEAWFLALWAAFIFLFFSASSSKLIPYILPAFPPLAVLCGRWLGAGLGRPDALPRLLPALRTFAFLCGLLAAALGIAVLRPGVIRDAAQASELRPYALVLAAVLCIGGFRALARRGAAGSGRAAVIVLVATAVLLLGIVVTALPLIDTRSTKDLALAARAAVRPGDRVYAYHGFFHDFTYYTGAQVGLVAYTDELETQFLDPADRARRFIGDDEFRREWAGPGRVFAVARVRDAVGLFADPTFRYHLIKAGPHHYLFSNQP